MMRKKVVKQTAMEEKEDEAERRKGEGNANEMYL